MLFRSSYSVELFEKIGHDNIHRYTSIKKGINKGKWPDDFLKELAKPDTVSENTHFNKDGAMLITEGLVELILKSNSLYFTRAMSSVEGMFGKLKLPYKKLLVGGAMLSILYTIERRCLVTVWAALVTAIRDGPHLVVFVHDQRSRLYADGQFVQDRKSVV